MVLTLLYPKVYKLLAEITVLTFFLWEIHDMNFHEIVGDTGREPDKIIL